MEDKINVFKKSSKKISVKYRLLIAVAAAVLFFFLTWLKTPIRHLNDDLSDLVYQSESGYQLPVCIIGIDDVTMENLGHPNTWSRQMYADLMNNIIGSEYEPTVVGFDICFTGNRDIQGDKAFAEISEKYGHVVSALNVLFEEAIEQDDTGSHYNPIKVRNTVYPYEALKKVSGGGFVDPFVDDDDYVRKLFISVKNENNEIIDSFSLALLKEYAERTGIELRDYSAETGKIYDFTFSSKPGVITEYSFYDVYTGKIGPEYFDGTVVLVGAYASGLQDDFLVPVSSGSKMYGVEIHANMIMALLEEKLQTRANIFVTSLIESVLLGIIVYVLLGLSLATAIIMSVAAIIVYVIVCIVAYKQGLYIDLFYMPAAIFIAILGYIIQHYVMEYFRTKKISKAFKMYVAPEIVDELSKDDSYNIQLSGENKDVAVLFVDIRGFTTMSENLKPQEVVAILNEYFEVVTNAIFNNKGTLDKFIGDAAMAVFNSPFDLDDYEYRAVKTAWEIKDGVRGLAERLKEKFGKTINCGIGINCGEATIGNIGSKFRMDFTAIGDTVNTAARLESNAKAGEIYISDELRNRLGDCIDTDDVGEIPLKGKSKSVFVYKVTKINELTIKRVDS